MEKSGIAAAGLVLASIAVAACASSESSHDPHQDAVELLSADGQVTRVAPPEGGVAAVSIFVATQCPISNTLAPEIKRIIDTYSPKGVSFFLVYADADETEDTVRKHAQDYGYTIPALLDPEHRLVDRVGATVTPEAAVQDASGKLVYLGRINDLYVDFGKQRAKPTRDDLRLALDAVCAGGAPKVARTKAIGCFIPDVK